jgi:hypothetical protein
MHFNLIHQRAATVSVKSLLQHLNISERHFERRFSYSTFDNAILL